MRTHGLGLRWEKRVQMLSNFHPPYVLSAHGCVVMGVWRPRDGKRTALPMATLAAQALGGYAPVRLLGGYVGMGFVLHYDRPPKEHPVAYREVIAAIALRRGARWAALPFDLVLDDEFNVVAGQHHYHIPKRLDRTLRIAVDASSMRASAVDIRFDADLGARAPVGFRGVSSALLHTMTKHGPVIGAATSPSIFASIPVRPDPRGARRARVRRFEVGALALESFLALYWDSMVVTLGAPRSAPWEYSCPVTEVSRAHASS